VGVVVEQARTPCASARLALLGSERAEFLVPQRLLGDEVVLGPRETPGDDDQLVELN